MTQKKVLVVDDDWAVRQALRDHLARRDLLVCEAESVDTALAIGAAEQPDVAVLDIALPEHAGERADLDGHMGIALARRLREALPQLGIVFLSAYADRGPEVVSLFMEGNEGIAYLVKGTKPQELVDAIRRVSRGHFGLDLGPGVRTGRTLPIDLALAALAPGEAVAAKIALAKLDALSPPELRVFDAIGGCLTQREAASRLSIAPKTVSSHMEAIYEKLDLHRAPEGYNPLALLAKIHLLHRLATAK